MTLGKEFGFEGQELLNFIKKKEKEMLDREASKEREMREWAEKKERDKLEREDKLVREAAERNERARVREDHIREMELENENELKTLELERTLPLEMLEKEIELEKVKAINVESKKKGFQSKHEIKSPKLPPFKEGNDNIDAYRLRFERFALVIGWPQEEWAIRLSSLLKGKSLETYCRLSQVDSENYDKVKHALLKRFELTQEGFRQKFRSCRPEVGESAPQFAQRLENYLERWIDL